MKQITLILLIFFTFSCYAQTEKLEDVFLTVSPVIDKERPQHKLIISTLIDFLKSKNSSLSANDFWLKSDFEKYVYPYLDIYNIEQSKHGKDFFKPSLMEVLSTANEKQKILKIAFIGHNPKTKENVIKCVYNIIANVEGEKIKFSRYLDVATGSWTTQKVGSINYVVSPNRKLNVAEMELQRKEVTQLVNFFQTESINITYYSCVNPKELFEIKGFDYNPMMYVDKSGGLADFGNIIFSGNSAEIYTHEIIHVYTNKLYPNLNKFIDEGLATYIAGSGKYDYKWHRTQLRKFIAENPTHDFKAHFDPYERLYFEDETSIPYLTAALICERTNRMYGKDKLLQLLKSKDEIWNILNTVGLTEENLNKELLKEIKRPITPVW